jgi:signal transduction histidine kinase
MPRYGTSIKNRVRAVILLATCIVLVATAAVFAVYEVISFKAQLARNVSTLAAIVAESSAAALAFESPDSTTDILYSLRAEPDIMAAVLYDSAGEVFATFPARLPRAMLPQISRREGYAFSERELTVVQPVNQEGKRVGTLFIRYSLQGLYDRLANYGFLLGIVLAGSLAGAFLLSTVLQRRITEPILALASTARTIAQQGNYNLRAEKLSMDEVGALTDSFNHMLEQIRQRERELVTAHEELAQHQQRLERTVAERTAALRDTVQQLETFSYSIAHDMRAPLRTMNNFAAFLCSEEADKLSDTGRDYLNRIMLGAERLDALIKDVLDYSRVSKGEAAIEPVVVSEVIASTIREYPDLNAGAARIEIREPLPRVMGNASLLRQCMSNLLGNALKFVPSDRVPKVVVRAEKVGNSARIWVEDNGIGIPAAERKDLFGLFHRLSTSAGFPGTGVGLATVKRAVERMNGSIGVESEAGSGSRFWIELPAADPN